MKLKITNYQKDNQLSIDKIVIDLEQNNSVALIGPNKSGKTTIMNILGLMERCETFSVKENGETMYPFLSNSKKAYLERRIATLDENPFVDFLTTNEQFQILNQVDPQKEYNQARYEALCTYFEFDKYANYLISDLTQKNLQKMQIILTFASNNKYIFMDDPMAGLDNKTKVKLTNLINEQKNSGKKFIIAAPQIDTLSYFSDYYIFIDNGSIKDEGKPSYFQKKYGMELNDTLYSRIYSEQKAA